MSLLDQLYPQGISKTASTDEIDLTQISAADFLAMQEQGQEEIDLTQISAADFLAMQEGGPEKVAGTDEDALLQAMIDNGTFAEMDLAGRIMARAQLDELSKHAGVEEGDEVDLTQISAAQLIELVESGEFELEKDAGFASALERAGAAAEKAKTWAKGLPVGAKISGHAWGKALAAPSKSAKAAYQAARGGGSGRTMSAAKGADEFLASRMGKGQAAAGVAAAGAAGYGGYRLHKRSKKK